MLVMYWGVFIVWVYGGDIVVVVVFVSDINLVL